MTDPNPAISRLRNALVEYRRCRAAWSPDCAVETDIDMQKSEMDVVFAADDIFDLLESIVEAGNK
jgi:hypothetical protein